MNKNDVKTIAYVVGIAVVTTVSLKRSAKIIREENAKRKEIEKNAHLDIEAIKLAGAKISDQIKHGKYDGNFNKLMTDFNDQIEFEKIAIRFKD